MEGNKISEHSLIYQKMDLGNTIRYIRKQKGLTQNKCASLCGITQTYFSQIECNLKEPNLSTLKVISEKLEVPLPIIFFLSMNEEDIHSSKRIAYKEINHSLRLLVNEVFKV